MVWVYETRNGVLTGNMSGHETRWEASEYVARMRRARDNDPTFAQYRAHGTDWMILPTPAATEEN